MDTHNLLMLSSVECIEIPAINEINYKVTLK